MSASAVATPVQLQPPAASSNNQDMEDEDQVDIAEEDIDEDLSKSNDELDDKDMVELSEAESQTVDAQLRAMAVSSTKAPRDHQPPSANTSTGTRSAGESVDDANSQDRPKPFIRTCNKFESGSGSGDQDGMVSMEDGVDVAVKKRKTRRGKPKHRKLKPYSKQQPSYQQRLRTRATGRPERKASRQPTAPYNTTQFLMEDHNDLPDLDKQIAATGSSAVAAMANEVHSHFSRNDGASRTRESSFSIDSDNDYFYSSPEDEEEFLQKEFTTAYEDEHTERLGTMSRAQLIQEYMQLEAKVELLNKRLRKSQAPVNDSEMASKLRSYQLRIDELQKENEQLRRDNDSLRKQRHGSLLSSEDSESDSASSDSKSTRASQNASLNSSPVPVSYQQAKRDKTTHHARDRNNSVSSVDSESDSISTTNGSAPDNDELVALDVNPRTTAPVQELANGHATPQQIDGLPT